jgi:neutral amino acid transport system ATP-binding protein
MPASTVPSLSDVEPRPGVPKPDPILVVDGVRRQFGGLVAVDVEHLEIPRGVITALIGPNGAGKTTFFNLMTGFDDPNQGTWTFHGRDGAETALAGMAPHRVARTGMVRTFQLTKSLTKMSVLENMKLGAPANPGESVLRALLPAAWNGYEADTEERADELLRRFKLDHMRDQYAGTLSGGQRKLLEMARSLMVEPELVMLDEPMAGVNPALTQSLLEHVKGLRDEAGMSVVFVEHDMDVVMEISDWVVCMAEGRIISEGPPDHVGNDPAVIDAYLGGDHGEKGEADETVRATAEEGAEPDQEEQA